MKKLLTAALLGIVEDIDGNRQRVRIEDRVYTVIRDTREILNILDQ